MAKKRTTKKTTKGSKSGASALKKVNAIAKGIKKSNPSKKWASCLKEAGAKYRRTR